MSSRTAGAICITAAELVTGGRQVTHGDKQVNFKNIAFIWNAILAMKLPAVIEDPLSPLDVANMLEAMKIARRYTGTHNLDDYVDGAGYAGCAGEIAEKMNAVESFDSKTAINKRVQARYDELMREGKHGHYETMFRVVHEELAVQKKET